MLSLFKWLVKLVVRRDSICKSMNFNRIKGFSAFDQSNRANGNGKFRRSEHFTRATVLRGNVDVELKKREVVEWFKSFKIRCTCLCVFSVVIQPKKDCRKKNV